MTAVCFLGLGRMGGPMAANIVRAGFRVAGFDPVPAAVEAAAEAGVRSAGSPAEAAEGADIVVTMLPEHRHVSEAAFGDGGAAGVVRPGALWIEMSTIGPSDSDALREDLAARGIRMVDAPVGRTPEDARRGTLLVMAGGTEADVAEARPLFDAVGDTVVHVGGPGSGIRLKVLNNYMSMVGMVLTAEALAAAAKAGLDRDIVVKVMSGTAAGRGQLVVNYPKKVLAGDITPDFPLRLGLKDISLALQFGNEIGAPLALGAVAKEFFALAKSWGRSEQDCTAMLFLLEDLAKMPHTAPSSSARAVSASEG